MACYKPATDAVGMPDRERFESTESYYATLFHELVHSTGHRKRLDRGLDPRPPPFGSADYSKEELVAEMGASFLAAHAGISPATIEQSAAYIDGWRRKLRDDKKLVVQAAGAGQRAADHILGVAWDEATNNTKQDSTPTSADIAELPLTDRLKADLQAFPRPGQANLNSTATTEQRSAYIAAVLGWWNERVDRWVEHNVLNPSRNPAVYRPGAEAAEARP
jgi:hypothetical protein